MTRLTSSIPQPIFRAAADGWSQDIDKCVLMSIEIKQKPHSIELFLEIQLFYDLFFVYIVPNVISSTLVEA